MFQDVSKCFGVGNLTRHQNDPGEPVIQACLESHFIENQRLKVVWLQDVSGRCFGVGNLGHYEMTRATKMTPVNL